MKPLKEIEDISQEMLEQIADDTSVTVPEELKDLAEDALSLSVFLDTKPVSSTARIISFAAPLAAVAAATALLLTLPGAQLKDTYDDPALAYAEIERTLIFISSKMSSGIDIAAEAESNISAKANEMLEKVI